MRFALFAWAAVLAVTFASKSIEYLSIAREDGATESTNNNNFKVGELLINRIRGAENLAKLNVLQAKNMQLANAPRNRELSTMEYLRQEGPRAVFNCLVVLFFLKLSTYATFEVLRIFGCC